MTIDLAAIFGPDAAQINTASVSINGQDHVQDDDQIQDQDHDDPTADAWFPWLASDPADLLPVDDDQDHTGAAPIVEGTQHWNPYIDPADLDAGRWGEEFIPGYHVDLRQPSQLRGMCSGRLDTESTGVASTADREPRP